MSIYVLREVWEHTRSEGAAWRVLTALGETGSKEEGVCYPKQDAIRRFGSRGRPLSERAVRDALRWLEENGEIEVRVAQRGRARVNVYRIILGKYGETDPESWDLDLPFEVTEPWSRPAEVAARRARLAGGGMDAGLADDPASRPADSAARQEADDRQIPTATTGRFRPRRPANPAVPASYRGPSEEPAAGPGDAAAGSIDLHARLDAQGIDGELLAEALADPDRATAWIELAERDADLNVGGYFRAGFQRGGWPGPRVAAPAPVSAMERDRRIVEQLVGNLGPEYGPDEARYRIDHEWATLTTVERAELHALVDELCSDALPEPAGASARGAA